MQISIEFSESRKRAMEDSWHAVIETDDYQRVAAEWGPTPDKALERAQWSAREVECSDCGSRNQNNATVRFHWDGCALDPSPAPIA